MKELSIEQKAKRYDEAIEKGKQIQNIPYTAHWDIMKEVVEHLLPELRESEDERIRKALLNEFIHLQSKGYKFAGLEGEEIITWLEKQGEHNPANWLQELEDILANATPKQLAEWKEKYFKDEPAWSEEDERHIKRIVERLEDIRKSKEDNIDVASVILSEINWLKSLKSQKQWKPSKQQMEALREACNLYVYDTDVDTLDTLYHQLKLL